MRIAIDGMGGDYAPEEIVLGAIEAAPKHPDAKLILVGQKDRLARPTRPPNVESVYASEVVGMDDDPGRALRGKPDSSLRVALRLVKHGEADAIISAGNTGALVGGAIVPVFGLGNLEGVKRPGIAIPFPTDKGLSAIVDVGANPYARPLHLVQYAVMGAVYVKYLRPDIGVPRMGILNIGEEPRKGTSLIRETYSYLEKADLNFEFVGNVEPHTLFAGKVHVVVCDGFVGNLMLKIVEGVTGYITRQFLAGLAHDAAVRQDILRATEKLEFSAYGGAPVLGVRGIVIKAHGRSKADAIANAIRLTAGFIRDKLNEHIVGELRRLSWSSSWFAKWINWSKEDE